MKGTCPILSMAVVMGCAEDVTHCTPYVEVAVLFSHTVSWADTPMLSVAQDESDSARMQAFCFDAAGSAR